jgi:hypothetical protein
VDEYLLEIFQDELHTQCQFIVIGARLANANLGPPGTKGNLRAVWFALQGLLVAASNASKLLWGSRQEPLLEARRPLRESVGVDDSSPLSSRRVRNDFEHFDERLEVRFGGGKRGRYLGRNIESGSEEARGAGISVATSGQRTRSNSGRRQPMSSDTSTPTPRWCRSGITRQI